MPTMAIRRINVLSIAKWVCLTFAIMGVFAGIIYGVSLMYSGEGSRSLAVFYIVSLPIEYAFVGFISTAFTGLIYNSVARTRAGIVLEFDMTPVGSEPTLLDKNGRQT